jgi:hypothetical protein
MSLARAAKIALAMIVLSGGSGFWLWNRKDIPPPSSGSAATVVEPPPRAQPLPVAAGPLPPVTRKPLPPKGWIQVEADEDVRVFVDENEIPRTDWKRIPVNTGKRSLRLIKSGFLPIENVIDVRPNKVAVVKAKREDN